MNWCRESRTCAVLDIENSIPPDARIWSLCWSLLVLQISCPFANTNWYFRSHMATNRKSAAANLKKYPEFGTYSVRRGGIWKSRRVFLGYCMASGCLSNSRDIRWWLKYPNLILISHENPWIRLIIDTFIIFFTSPTMTTE